MAKANINLKKVDGLKEPFMKMKRLMDSSCIKMVRSILVVWKIWNAMDMDNIIILMGL